MRTPVRHKGASTQGGRRRQVLFALPLLIVAFWWTHQPSRPGTKVVDSRAAKPVHGTKEALQTATKQTEHAEVLDLQQAGADAGAADAAARQPPHDSRTNAEKAAAHEPQGLDAEDGSGKGPGASAALPQQPHCSEERRAETLEGVLGGELPPVMSWGCNLLPQCDERFVAQTAEYLRATPRFASLLSLLPCDLWALICGRTLWLAGDSQSQRFYAQLRCFLADYAAEGQAGKEVPAVKDEQQRKSLSEALATEAGAAAVLPSCTLLAGGTRLCLARADTGEHMLRHLHHLKGLGLAAGDIWEFNVGLRHHQEEGEYGRLVAQLADYYSQHRQQLPTLIWRDTPPQHFDTQNGEAPHPAEAAEALEGHSICRPIRDVELLPDGSLAGDNAYVQGGGWRNQAATPLFEAAGMPIHHIWNDTVPLHGGHAAGECSDFCSPGAYGLHTWSLWSLLAELQREGRLPPPVAADDAAAAAADGQQPNPLGSQRDAVAAAAAAEAAAGTAAAVAAPRTAQAADNDRAINLAAKANRLLSRRMTWRSAASPYFRCKPDSLQLTPLTDGSLEHLLRGIAEPEPQVVWVNVTSVPCSRLDPEGDGTLLPGCCSQPFSFRVNSTDILVFQQIFRHHYLRALYVLMKGHEPRYILDAGANAGFSTALFKLLWPNTTVVSLEPDPSNFAALQRNTAEFEGVHRVRAGLWGRRANITQVFDDGDWGKIFRESAPGQPGLPALSVADVAAEYGIPAFDYVKIDIEGAEGMVFAPGADVSWIQGTKLVSLEVHDSFAKHFGLKAVTGRVDAAFSGLNFSMSSDNEHIYYIHADILPPSRITTRTSTTAAARWQG